MIYNVNDEDVFFNIAVAISITVDDNDNDDDALLPTAICCCCCCCCCPFRENDHEILCKNYVVESIRVFHTITVFIRCLL